jgi:hypothetical protein
MYSRVKEILVSFPHHLGIVRHEFAPDDQIINQDIYLNVVISVLGVV